MLENIRRSEGIKFFNRTSTGHCRYTGGPVLVPIKNFSQNENDLLKKYLPTNLVKGLLLFTLTFESTFLHQINMHANNIITHDQIVNAYTKGGDAQAAHFYLALLRLEKQKISTGVTR